MREFFSDLHCGKLVGLLEVKFTNGWCLQSPGDFNVLVCSHRASSNKSVVLAFLPQMELSAFGLLLQWVLILPICLSTSLVWGQWFALWPPFSLLDVGRNRWCFLCSFFKSFVRIDGDKYFQAASMLGWKPESRFLSGKERTNHY